MDDDFWWNLAQRPWMPWNVARKLFKPDDEEPASWIENLGRARSIAGFVITLWAFHDFKDGPDNGVVDDLTANAQVSIMTSIGATILVGVIFLSRNRDTSDIGFQPVMRALAALATILVWYPEESYFGKSGIIGFVDDIFSVWYRIFVLVCLGYWYWYPLGSSRKYPLISPIVTVITVITATCTSLVSGKDIPVSYARWLFVTLSGTLIVLALASLEIYKGGVGGKGDGKRRRHV